MVAACWALGEIARGYALTGFPWLSIAYAHIESPMTGLAPLIGVYGMGMVDCLADRVADRTAQTFRAT